MLIDPVIRGFLHELQLWLVGNAVADFLIAVTMIFLVGDMCGFPSILFS